MKCTKNDRDSSWFQKIFIKRERVDIRIRQQYCKHIIISLFNDIMKWSITSLIQDVQIKYLTALILVDLNTISQSLMLLLLDANMHWRCFQWIDEIQINWFAFNAFSKDLLCQIAIFIILDQKQMNNVGAYLTGNRCVYGIWKPVSSFVMDVFTKFHHPVCNVKPMAQYCNMKRIAMLFMKLVEIWKFLCVFTIKTTIIIVDLIVKSFLLEFQYLKQYVCIFRGELTKCP